MHFQGAWLFLAYIVGSIVYFVWRSRGVSLPPLRLIVPKAALDPKKTKVTTTTAGTQISFCIRGGGFLTLAPSRYGVVVFLPSPATPAPMLTRLTDKLRQPTAE